MKAKAVAVILLLSEFGAVGAHEMDPQGKIVLRCWDSGQVRVRMTQIDDALANSRYWAPQAVRREMLASAQTACLAGAKRIRFVPVNPAVDVQGPAIAAEIRMQKP